MLKLLNYIDCNYQNAFLTVFCKENNVDLYFMGRLIHKQSEQTFQQLLADYRIEIKRLNFYITKFDSNEKRDKSDNHVLMISILISFFDIRFIYNSFSANFAKPSSLFVKSVI